MEKYNFDDLEKPTKYQTSGVEGIWPSQGKCDLRDHLCMLRDDNSTVKDHVKKVLATTTFNVDEFILKSDTLQDIAPYMFSIISTGAFGGEHNSITLTKRPWIDTEEFETLMWRSERIFKYFKYCKTKRLNPDLDSFFTWNRNFEKADAMSQDRRFIYKVMFNRYLKHNWEKSKNLKKLSKEGLCKDLHLGYKNYVRESLVDFLVGIDCKRNHPMIMKYQRDIFHYYLMMNDLMDEPFNDVKDFHEEWVQKIVKRGW